MPVPIYEYNLLTLILKIFFLIEHTDDECQFWLNETAGELTSPHFDYITFQNYKHNLNCTWILKAEDGFYINLEIYYFQVRMD